jgi:S-formylglutathione hydrolase FrmB
MLRRRLLAVAALLAVGIAVWLVLRPGGLAGTVDRHGADVVEMEIASDAVGEQMPVTVVVPADADEGSPLLVFLHGRGGDEDSELKDELFSALDALGDRAPIVAFPYGDEASYWHNRADGAWADYVLDEVIPKVGERVGADTGRVAIGGISMGGYGAYNVARVEPGRFCAVGGHSPALWQTAGETAAGAFDDAEDFAANDVIAAAATDPAAFTGQPLWLDAGDEDPFLPGDEAFVQALESAGGEVDEHIWPGAHEGEYWDSHLDEYMRFYARSLAHC